MADAKVDLHIEGTKKADLSVYALQFLGMVLPTPYGQPGIWRYAVLRSRCH